MVPLCQETPLRTPHKSQSRKVVGTFPNESYQTVSKKPRTEAFARVYDVNFSLPAVHPPGSVGWMQNFQNCASFLTNITYAGYVTYKLFCRSLPSAVNLYTI